jgi:hypothetical protein
MTVRVLKFHTHLSTIALCGALLLGGCAHGPDAVAVAQQQLQIAKQNREIAYLKLGDAMDDAAYDAGRADAMDAGCKKANAANLERICSVALDDRNTSNLAQARFDDAAKNFHRAAVLLDAAKERLDEAQAAEAAHAAGLAALGAGLSDAGAAFGTSYESNLDQNMEQVQQANQDAIQQVQETNRQIEQADPPMPDQTVSPQPDPTLPLILEQNGDLP